MDDKRLQILGSLFFAAKDASLAPFGDPFRNLLRRVLGLPDFDASASDSDDPAHPNTVVCVPWWWIAPALLQQSSLSAQQVREALMTSRLEVRLCRGASDEVVARARIDSPLGNFRIRLPEGSDELGVMRARLFLGEFEYPLAQAAIVDAGVLDLGTLPLVIDVARVDWAGSALLDVPALSFGNQRYLFGVATDPAGRLVMDVASETELLGFAASTAAAAGPPGGVGITATDFPPTSVDGLGVLATVHRPPGAGVPGASVESTTAFSRLGMFAFRVSAAEAAANISTEPTFILIPASGDLPVDLSVFRGRWDSENVDDANRWTPAVTGTPTDFAGTAELVLRQAVTLAHIVVPDPEAPILDELSFLGFVLGLHQAASAEFEPGLLDATPVPDPEAAALLVAAVEAPAVRRLAAKVRAPADQVRSYLIARLLEAKLRTALAPTDGLHHVWLAWCYALTRNAGADSLSALVMQSATGVEEIIDAAAAAGAIGRHLRPATVPPDVLLTLQTLVMDGLEAAEGADAGIGDLRAVVRSAVETFLLSVGAQRNDADPTSEDLDTLAWIITIHTAYPHAVAATPQEGEIEESLVWERLAEALDDEVSSPSSPYAVDQPGTETAADLSDLVAGLVRVAEAVLDLHGICGGSVALVQRVVATVPLAWTAHVDGTLPEPEQKVRIASGASWSLRHWGVLLERTVAALSLDEWLNHIRNDGSGASVLLPPAPLAAVPAPTLAAERDERFALALLMRTERALPELVLAARARLIGRVMSVVAEMPVTPAEEPSDRSPMQVLQDTAPVWLAALSPLLARWIEHGAQIDKPILHRSLSDLDYATTSWREDDDVRVEGATDGAPWAALEALTIPWEYLTPWDAFSAFTQEGEETDATFSEICEILEINVDRIALNYLRLVQVLFASSPPFLRAAILSIVPSSSELVVDGPAALYVTLSREGGTSVQGFIGNVYLSWVMGFLGGGEGEEGGFPLPSLYAMALGVPVIEDGTPLIEDYEPLPIPAPISTEDMDTIARIGGLRRSNLLELLSMLGRATATGLSEQRDRIVHAVMTSQVRSQSGFMLPWLRGEAEAADSAPTWCACDPCTSVLSPGAWLLDVLAAMGRGSRERLERFPSLDPTNPDGWSADGLQTRRSDVLDLRVDCASADVVMPQIDLANEILEARLLDYYNLGTAKHVRGVSGSFESYNFGAFQLPVAPIPDQTVGTTAERIAEPQSTANWPAVDDVVSRVLAPRGVPVALAAKEIDAWLAAHELQAADLVALFGGSAEEPRAIGVTPTGSGSAWTISARGARRLAWTALDLELFVSSSNLDAVSMTNTDPRPSDDASRRSEVLRSRWLTGSGESLTSLCNVATWMKAFDASEDDLRALLASRFVNPGLAWAIVGVNGTDPWGCDLNERVLSTTARLGVSARFVATTSPVGAKIVVEVTPGTVWTNLGYRRVHGAGGADAVILGETETFAYVDGAYRLGGAPLTGPIEWNVALNLTAEGTRIVLSGPRQDRLDHQLIASVTRDDWSMVPSPTSLTTNPDLNAALVVSAVPTAGAFLRMLQLLRLAHLTRTTVAEADALLHAVASPSEFDTARFTSSFPDRIASALRLVRSEGWTFDDLRIYFRGFDGFGVVNDGVMSGSLWERLAPALPRGLQHAPDAPPETVPWWMLAPDRQDVEGRAVVTTPRATGGTAPEQSALRAVSRGSRRLLAAATAAATVDPGDLSPAWLAADDPGTFENETGRDWYTLAGASSLFRVARLARSLGTDEEEVFAWLSLGLPTGAYPAGLPDEVDAGGAASPDDTLGTLECVRRWREHGARGAKLVGALRGTELPAQDLTGVLGAVVGWHTAWRATLASWVAARDELVSATPTPPPRVPAAPLVSLPVDPTPPEQAAWDAWVAWREAVAFWLAGPGAPAADDATVVDFLAALDGLADWDSADGGAVTLAAGGASAAWGWDWTEEVRGLIDEEGDPEDRQLTLSRLVHAARLQAYAESVSRHHVGLVPLPALLVTATAIWIATNGHAAPTSVAERLIRWISRPVFPPAGVTAPVGEATWASVSANELPLLGQVEVALTTARTASAAPTELASMLGAFAERGEDVEAPWFPLAPAALAPVVAPLVGWSTAGPSVTGLPADLSAGHADSWLGRIQSESLAATDRVTAHLLALAPHLAVGGLATALANWASGPHSWLAASLGRWLADTNHAAGLSAVGMMSWLASDNAPVEEDLTGDDLPLQLWRVRALADGGVGASWWEDAEALGWVLGDVPLLKPAATSSVHAVAFALEVAALEDEIHLAEEGVDLTTGTRLGVLGVVAAARAAWAADEEDWWDDPENAWVLRLGLSDAERLALRSANGLSTADAHQVEGFDDAHENVLRSRPMWSLHVLRRADRAVAIARRLGVDLRAVTDALAPNATADDAAVLRTALRDARGEAAWPELAKVVLNEVREQRRDAMVQALLRMHRFWQDGTDLFRAFLFDPMVNAPVQTSRTLFAMLAVQAYVQRVLLGLESLQDPLPAEFGERWTWMREYRVWEAARKVFLFPENWIDPELLLSKTPEFEGAERLLRSGTITEEGIESAYVAYLQGLTDVANLTIVSFVTDTPYEAHGRRSFAVLGRQRSEAGAYFLRRRTALGDWTPWRRLDFDPTNGPVALYHDGRGLQVVQVTLLGVAEEEDGSQSGLPRAGVVEVRATIFPMQGDRLGTPQIVEGNVVVVDRVTPGIGRMDRKVSLLGIRPGESVFEPFVTRAEAGMWSAARWQDLMRRGPAIAIAMEIGQRDNDVSETKLLGWLAPASCGNGWAFEAAVPAERTLELDEVSAYSMWTDPTLAVPHTKARYSRLVAEGQDTGGRRPLRLATNLFQIKNGQVLKRGAVEQLHRPFRVTLPTDTRLRRTWISGVAGGFAQAAAQATGPGGFESGIGLFSAIVGSVGIADVAETEDLFFHDDQGRAYTVTAELRRTAGGGTASPVASSTEVEDEELTAVVDLGQDVFDRFRDLEPTVLVDASSSYGSTPDKDVVLDEETPLSAQLGIFPQLSTVPSEG
jgi:hypothetical protein